ncbi:O-antigen polymerase [Phocaeicola sartorii]|uniref:O-antigen polymerase n=1 Tax=Phocaeicola sartorii TaxID=671267 RepID=UPI00248BD068|nr:O-antigen polymerase [Phocaeicola sartorii]
MNSELIILSASTLLLVVFCFWSYRQANMFRTTFAVLGVYSLSSVASIVYYCQPYSAFLLNGRISWLPFIYWIVLFMICLIPLIQFDKLHVGNVKSLTTLDWIAKFGFWISIIPLIEQLFIGYRLLFGTGGLEEAIMAAYEDATLDQLSIISRNLLRINIGLYDLSFLILLTYFIRPVKNKSLLIYSLTIIMTRNVTGLMMASRGAMVNMGLRMILVYVISFPFLTVETKKLINKCMLICAVVFGAIFVSISIGRQVSYSENVNEGFTMTYFISRYMGEGLINFNQYLPLMKETTGGEICFWSIMDYLGGEPHELTKDYFYGELSSKQNIPQNVFYTFIGNFVQDLNFIGAFIWLSFISIVFKIVTKVKGPTITLSTLFAFLFYATMMLNGVISFQYAGSHGKFVIWNIFIYIYMKMKKM